MVTLIPNSIEWHRKYIRTLSYRQVAEGERNQSKTNKPNFIGLFGDKSCLQSQLLILFFGSIRMKIVSTEIVEKHVQNNKKSQSRDKMSIISR